MAIIHLLNNEPNVSVGSDGDVAIYSRFIYFRNNGEWIKVSGDIGKHRNANKDELAIWEGNIKVKGSKKLKFNESIGLVLDKLDEASSDTDKFLVSDDGVLKYRTGAQLLSDIGADTHTDASTSAKGVVELATTAETTTGTSTTLAVTPDGLKDGYEGSGNIETVGDLDSGAITGNFGNIDNGSSTLDTGALTCRSNTTTGSALTSTSSDDKLISATQTLNQDTGGVGTQEYRMIKTNLTDTASGGWDNVYLIDQQVGGASKFNVDKSGNATFNGTVTANNVLLGRFHVRGQYEVYGRYSTLNTWYIGNQSFGTSIAEGDWGGGFKYNYAQFTAVSNVKLLGWKWHGAFSSTVDWEMEVWHTETPADGESDPEEANRVGNTQSVSPTATRLYSLGETGLTYSVPAGDQLYVLTRFTSGSGTKYSYGTVGFEFSY